MLLPIFGMGDTPTYRDYSGPPIAVTSNVGVCNGPIHYSVMGKAIGSRCGYDNTGGYEAVKAADMT